MKKQINLTPLDLMGMIENEYPKHIHEFAAIESKSRGWDLSFSTVPNIEMFAFALFLLKVNGDKIRKVQFYVGTRDLKIFNYKDFNDHDTFLANVIPYINFKQGKNK